MAERSLRTPVKVAFLICVGIIVSSNNSTNGQEAGKSVRPASERHLEDNSIKDATFANLRAWQSGDVLVRIEKLFDASKIDTNGVTSGVILKEVTLNRAVFDFKENKIANFVVRRNTQVDFENKEDPIETDAIGGLCFDGLSDDVFVFSNDRLLKRVRKKFSADSIKFMQQIGFSDYRGIFYTGSPRSHAVFGASQIVALSSSGENIESTKRTGNILEILSLVKSQSSESGVRSYIRERYDTKILMPISLKSYSIGPDGSERFGTKRTVAWKELNGVYVPQKFASTQAERRTVDGKDHIAMVKSDYKFHWFSLNKPVDSEFFDGSRFENRETFLKYVDPIQAGATTLLPDSQVEKQQEK